MLHPMRDRWDTSFAPGGPEALGVLARRNFDVIVSDMRMPKMTGVELLKAVRQGYPSVARLVLSGQASDKTILSTVTQAHQYLPKPCNSETLRHSLDQLSALRELLASERLRGLIAGLQCLPSHPWRYRRFVEGAQAPAASMESLGQIAARDLAMSAKALQLVSSAFFGQPKQAAVPEEAMTFLGLDRIRVLAGSRDVFRPLRETRSVSLIEALSRHGLLVAQIAEAIARDTGADQKLARQAYVAGMLHDVGKLLLMEWPPSRDPMPPGDLAELPQEYGQAVSVPVAQGVPELEAERSAFGAGHGEVGAYLLGLWGLPDPVVEAVAFHHQPSRASPAGALSPLAAVHAADPLARDAERDTGAALPAGLDADYISALGLLERLPTWRRISRQIMEKEAAYEREDTLCRR
jgi:putative nucleotidyltransferase with HDIG domain